MPGLPDLESDCYFATYLCICVHCFGCVYQAEWCVSQLVRMQDSRKPSCDCCVHDDADQAPMPQSSAGS